MIHSEYNEEETDQDLVREYAETLIKEIKDSTMNRQQAIHAASITVQRLAKETAKKFYYQVMQYLMDK
tara:strand:- start:2328 stop:2531 length:204 start_codon:yes stop_codon:yes gene_type:complete